jgi:hypothetical protein
MSKRLLALVFIFSLVSHAYAQLDSEKLFYLQKAEKYRRMKNTGATLTVVGAAAFIYGVVVASNSSTTYTYQNGNTYTHTEGNPGMAAACILLGSGGLGAGIPLWIVGNHAEDKYKKKLAGVALNLKFYENNAGLGVSWRIGSRLSR